MSPITQTHEPQPNLQDIQQAERFRLFRQVIRRELKMSAEDYIDLVAAIREHKEQHS